jgi:hypothetical protein
MVILYEKDLAGRWLERGRSEKVMCVQHCGRETSTCSSVNAFGSGMT